MKETILCMFSGGLDSTAVLYKLLTEEQYSDYNIHVHHMHLRNIEYRAMAESTAIRNIFEYFEENNFKHFVFTENIIETFFLHPPKFTRFIFDSDIMAFFAANICLANSSMRKVAVGHTKTDIELAHNLVVRRERMQKILEASYFPNEPTTEWYYPLINLTKQETSDILPKELRNLTWSCRNPTYNDGIPSVCGKCLTCKEMEEIVDNSQIV